MSHRQRRDGPVFAVVAVALAAILGTGRLSAKAESHPRANYSLIEDGLYLGGRVPEPPPGTRAVLNLCEAEDGYRAEVHRRAPIPDAGAAPGLDWLRQQVTFIDEHRRAGRPVFVHCRAGISRSGMVVAAYLMARDRCTRDVALKTLRARRPLVQPNPAFMRLLLRWEKVVRARPPGGRSRSPVTVIPDSAAGAPDDKAGHILVKVSADALLWFDGRPIASTGPTRAFHTAPLSGGRTLQVRAVWADGGRDVMQTQQVVVPAGGRVTVVFPKPAASKADKKKP